MFPYLVLLLMQGDSADYRPIERRLRPLLPANTESTGTSPEAKEDRSSEAHRRVTVACDTCRRRKVKVCICLLHNPYQT